MTPVITNNILKISEKIFGLDILMLVKKSLGISKPTTSQL